MEDHAIFDEAEALARVENDRELYRELLEIFFSELPDTWAQLREACMSGAGEEISRRAHSMKSALGNLGAMRAYALVQKMELEAGAGKVESSESDLQRLDQEIAQFSKAVAPYRL